MLRSTLHTGIRATRCYRKYSYEDVKKLVEKPESSKVLVDVREPAELKECSLPTSINLPLKTAPGALGLPAEEFERVFEVKKPPLESELVFFCRRGIRAQAAEELARSFGYTKTGVYEGSIEDWLAHGAK